MLKPPVNQALFLIYNLLLAGKNSKVSLKLFSECNSQICNKRSPSSSTLVL